MNIDTRTILGLLIFSASAACVPSAVDGGSKGQWVRATIEVPGQGATVIRDALAPVVIHRFLPEEEGVTCEPSYNAETGSDGLSLSFVVDEYPDIGLAQTARYEALRYQLPQDAPWHVLHTGADVEVTDRASDDSALTVAFTGTWCLRDDIQWVTPESDESCVEETRTLVLEHTEGGVAVADGDPVIWAPYEHPQFDDGSGLCGVDTLRSR